MLKRGVPLGDVLRWALHGHRGAASPPRPRCASGSSPRSCPAAELRDRAHALAASIAARDPMAIQGTVRAIWESLDMTRTMALQNGMAYTHIGNPSPDEKPAIAPKQKPRFR